MDEARRIVERLERIDGLRHRGAGPAVLLEDLRALVVEGERWLAAGRSAGDSAAEALARRRARLDEVPEPGGGKGVDGRAAL